MSNKNNTLESLKEMLDCDNLSAINMAEYYNKTIPNPIIIPLSVYDPCHFVRARKNEKIIFQNVKEITYPPKDKAKLERANLDLSPMFYGVIIHSPYDSDGLMSSLFESIPNLFGNNKRNNIIVTTGTWQIKKRLLIFTMPLPNRELAHNYISTCVVEKWDNKKSEYTQEDIDVVEFLGALMNEKGSLRTYTLTANYVNHVLRLNSNISGVTYPSVQTKGISMCVAIKPTEIESNTSLVKAQMHLCSKKEQMEAEVKTIANAEVVKDSLLIWKYKDGYSEDKIMKIIKTGII